MSLCRFIHGHRFLHRRLRRFLPARYPFQVHSHLQIYLDTADLYGPSFYLAHGGASAFYHYEEPLKSEILANLPATGTFFDLGANIGIHSCFVANHFPLAQVWAFEPGDNLQKCISATFEANGFKNARLVPYGVGERDEKIPYYADPLSSGGNSLVPESIGQRAELRGEVEVVSLDSFTAKEGIAAVDLLKIDVQEAEDAVLRGAKDLIRRCQPTLIIELSPQVLKEGKGEVFSLPSTYRVKEVGSPEFHRLEELPALAAQRAATHRHFDYVFHCQKT